MRAGAYRLTRPYRTPATAGFMENHEMNEKDYRRAWCELAQCAWEKLQDIAGRFRAAGYKTEIAEAAEEEGDGEMSQRLVLRTPCDVALASIEYRLFDGEVHLADGMAIGFSCFGPQWQIGSTYRPETFSACAYTRDLDVLRQRIENLPIKDFVEMVQADIARWQMRSIAA